MEACEDDASAFARKSSGVVANGLMMPNFMQKAASSSKENSGESSVPPNPLVRLRQEIRNQQSTSNLYEQIQLLAEQLRLSQQMMSVEAEEYNMYREDKVQMLEELQAQVDKKLREQQVAAQELNRSQSQSQKSSHPQNLCLEQAAAKPEEQHDGSLRARYQSFVEPQEAAPQQAAAILLPTLREARLPLSNSMIVGLNQHNNSQVTDPEAQPVHTQEVDGDVICISPNKKIIKKRSFVEVQQRRQHDAQREGASGSNDRCFSEHKSSRLSHSRKKCAKSDYFQKSNQRMREDSDDEAAPCGDQHSDHQSTGQKSGSSQLRSVKSLRKKNIQKEKSTFSAKRHIDDVNDLPDEQDQAELHQMNLSQMQMASFALGSGPEHAPVHGQSQPSALQKMIGPLTIAERHQRILKFITKKHNKNQAKKFTYECRK